MSKIVILLTGIFPYNSSGATLNKNIALGLVNNGCKVELNLMRGNSLENFNHFPNRVNTFNGFDFRYISFKKRPQKVLLKIVEAIIHPFLEIIHLIKLHKKGDVETIIINTGYLYSYLPIIIFAKCFNITIIKYSVDWFDKKSIVTKRHKILKWYLFQAQIKVVDKLLDGIIPISEYLYKHYMQMGFKKHELLLIPNFSVLNQSTYIERNNQDTYVYGFCGAAPLLNGVDDLLRAFSIVNNQREKTRLIIVGDVAAGNSQLPMLQQIANDLEISNLVQFIGRVSSKEVKNYLDQMDVLVLPRKKTKFADAGFPTKLGEYFNTKKPVILSKVGDFPSYFSDKKEVIFSEPDDYNSLASRMIYLNDHRIEGKIIGLNGYDWAFQNLDYNQNAKKVVKFIERLKKNKESV